AMITRLSIPGMRSNYCVSAIYTALTAVEGITRADIVIGTVTLEHDGRATPEALRAAIAVAGYAVADVVEERRRLV
ncbi:MAG TPA: heavy-metal-associated domain-containing protein, partial [Gemmatimonadaceae bacterium]|nr:heavy-metal-associated domain-containing protein [Gemmatimonadaceae bacterium]